MCIYPIIDDKKQLATGRPAATKSPFAIHHSYLTFLPLFFLFSSSFRLFAAPLQMNHYWDNNGTIVGQ